MKRFRVVCNDDILIAAAIKAQFAPRLNCTGNFRREVPLVVQGYGSWVFTAWISTASMLEAFPRSSRKLQDKVLVDHNIPDHPVYYKRNCLTIQGLNDLLIFDDLYLMMYSCSLINSCSLSPYSIVMLISKIPRRMYALSSTLLAILPA